MAKDKSEKKRVIRIVLILVSLMLVAAGIKIVEDVFASNVSKSGPLYWHTNYTFERNFESIKEQGVLKSPEALKRILELTGYDELVRPGRYILTEKTSNLDLMRMLVAGRQTPVDVLFRSGERIHDVCVFWSSQLEVDSTRLENLITSGLIYDSLGLNLENAIQLFVPNTYNFYWNTSEEKLVNRLIREYKVFWDSSRIRKAEALQLTPAEVGILASIVQKETYRREEMPVIAGVYWNRLKRGMPLQADPTILFALNDKSIRRVSGAMLEIEGPYNSYRKAGLPPGPICVSSVQAIDAVLNLQKHAFLFFCAREDLSGYHRFARTFAEHQVNARRYQRMLNAKGVK